jgi:hypothetical protein
MSSYKILNNNYFKPFAFACAYGIIYFIIQKILFHFGVFHFDITAKNLFVGDAHFYQDISINGYQKNNISSGFFILLPIIWKSLHASFNFILILNLLFYAFGFSLIVNILKQNKVVHWLFYISLPALFFVFIPYTEALFFLLCSLMLHAIHYNKKLLLFVILVLLSLVRPTCILLLPALLIMQVLANRKSKLVSVLIEYCYLMALPLILGLAIFIYIQFLQTGEWFVYFKTQAKEWDHHFSLPDIPFVTLPGAKNLWLNGLAFVIDLTALICVTQYAWQWLKHHIVFNKITVLSFSYLAMVLITILFFNPKYGNHSTILIGLYRYSFVTPFMLVFFNFISNTNISKKQILIVLLGTNLLWVFFHAYTGFKTFCSIALRNNIFIAFYFYDLVFSKSIYTKYVFILIHIIIQIIFIQNFMNLNYMD